jgi:hypothetical protein
MLHNLCFSLFKMPLISGAKKLNGRLDGPQDCPGCLNRRISYLYWESYPSTVDLRVTTDLIYEQLGLQQKILVLTYDQS